MTLTGTLLVSVVLTAGIFVLDVLTPRGTAEWVLYMIPLLLTFWAGPRYPVLLAAICTALIILGFVYSLPGIKPELSLINHSLGIAVLWVITLFIRERGRLEAQLRLQASALESAAKAIMITDREGRIVSVNPAFTRLTGYAEEEALGQNPRFLKSGKHNHAFIKKLWETILSGQVWEGEIINRRKDGSLYTEEETITPVRDERGEIGHFIAIKQDITDRKRADEALSRLAFIMESSDDAIIGNSLDGIILSWNPGAERIYGYSQREMIGQPISVLAPPDQPDEVIQILERTKWGERVGYFETVRMTKDGRRIEVSNTVSSIKDATGEVTGAWTIARDITERKRAEETRRALYEASLRIQEAMGLPERLDRLLHTARSVLELDRLNILLADPAGEWLEAVASLGTEEPLKAIRVPIGPEGGGISQAYLTRRMIFWDGSAPVPDPFRLQPPYDQIAAFRSQIFVNVPLAAQGRAIGVLGADRKHSRRPIDRTTLELLQLFGAQVAIAIEHGRLYEAQRMAAIQLEATVEARTRELHEAMKRAEGASRYKSEFLTNMSHELRTPLISILDFSELLQKRDYGPLTDKHLRFVHNIQESGRHLLALIDDLLDLSKVEAGRLELRRKPVHLPETIDAALYTVRPQTEAKGLALDAAVEAGLPPLLADPVRVRQILYNLLSNAIKFTPSGGSITITARRISSSEGRVSRSELRTRNSEPGAPQSPDVVEIAVADTGIGIKPEDLPRHFRFFARLEAALAKGHQGTGLGLALTKQLVELQGGQIEAASGGEGQGSTFTVRLPLTCPNAP